MFLENSDIRLRAIEPEDLEILYKWENSSHLWEHGNTLTPYSRFALKRYITDTQQTDIFENKQLRLMVELKEEGHVVVGTLDLYDFDFQNRKVGIGILIDERYRKQNYALQSLELIADYVFNFLNLHQMYAYISVDNEASVRLFTKAGYKLGSLIKDWLYIGKRYVDAVVFQLLNECNE